MAAHSRSETKRYLARLDVSNRLGQDEEREIELLLWNLKLVIEASEWI